MQRITTPPAAAGSRRQSAELEIALAIIIVLSGVYVAYDILAEPRGGHPFGHWLGIIGTLLMVMTETLYSLRKRTRLFNRWGPVRHWLSFHIVTGLVGPFLVLMHTGLRFRGLAGLTFWLTAVVVASGFIGRYLYTAVQRQQRLAVARQRGLDVEIDRLEAELAERRARHAARVHAAVAGAELAAPSTRWGRWQARWRARRAVARLERDDRDLAADVAALRARQSRGERRADQMERTSRLFQLWHTIHIPLGITLFVATAVHIAAAIFFRAGIFAP